MRKASRGFTLIELLVVIAIIGILSSVVIASLTAARDKAKVTNAVAQIREMRSVVGLYFSDTGTYPPDCGLDCTAATDPYLVSLGVPGWNGPYIGGGLHALAHQWGGHFTIGYGDVTDDGIPETYFFLDEDAPGTDWNDNSGAIPLAALEAIDARLDDGDLATGDVRGNGLGYETAAGELVVLPRY